MQCKICDQRTKLDPHCARCTQVLTLRAYWAEKPAGYWAVVRENLPKRTVKWLRTFLKYVAPEFSPLPRTKAALLSLALTVSADQGITEVQPVADHMPPRRW